MRMCNGYLDFVSPTVIDLLFDYKRLKGFSKNRMTRRTSVKYIDAKYKTLSSKFQFKVFKQKKLGEVRRNCILKTLKEPCKYNKYNTSNRKVILITNRAKMQIKW